MRSSSQPVEVATLGEARFRSPLRRSTTPGDSCPKFVPERCFVRPAAEVVLDAEPAAAPPEEDLLFEKAGPRQEIYFDPAKARAAVVTCGGLSPGLNNVIRSLYLELHKNYGVPEVVGIRYGYQGLNPQVGEAPVPLTMEYVEQIHERGGTVLGTSRGAQDAATMVDFLSGRGIDILFCLGGDGTQRGARAIHEEIHRRGLPIAVVGIPKTIDNDIPYCDRTFGFTTAVEAAQQVIGCAHVEAKGARDGIGLIKLMGREAGFIAAAATLASQEVNFILIPEVPFILLGENGLLEALRRRMIERHHAVIVVAEGAGQYLFEDAGKQFDASGNVKLRDIGPFLKQQIVGYFDRHGPKVDLKYIDPSYIIRSLPANCEDDALCDEFARRAAHAGMAGKTGLMIGLISGKYVHVPLRLVTGQRRRVDLEGEFWASVLASTGQPRVFA
jgi:6-phosphofructokinase 1